MSNSQSYEEVTVTADGVTVVKRFEEDEFPVPAIAFEFESNREESVTVRMSDTVPEQIEVEDLGFHPEYGSEFWTIDDETITFERELDAGDSYTTVYGIRATGSDDVEQFLTEPTIEMVDPPLPEEETDEQGEDIIPETDDDVVKDAISGDGEIPGLEDDGDEEGDDAEDITLNLNDPNESGEAQASTESGGDGAVSLEGTSLTGALANEIRQQNVSGEDLKLLRRALDVAEQKDGANKARIEQLQSDISDLRAYTSALEEFLDENGTGQELIEDFEAELSSFGDRLESIQSDLDANSAEVQSVSEDVEQVSETVSSVDQEVDELGTEVEEVTGTVESLEGEVDSVHSSVEEFESAIDDVEAQIDSLEESMPSEDVAERVSELEDDIDSLQTWQAQIKETFGGG